LIPPQQVAAHQNINDGQSFDISASGAVAGHAKMIRNAAKSGNGVTLAADPY